MSVVTIASRYAKSLLELAQEQGKLETVKEDIATFNRVLENREFALLVKSPIIQAEKKRSIFKAIFDGKIDELSAAFFDIIIRKGRESVLGDIAASFEEQYRVSQNITKAKVTTASVMSSSQLERIKASLADLDITGTVELETAEDPNLIGGFVLEIEDRLYDASVKNKLAELKKEILDNTLIKSL
ncbi:MAG: F-type H+-transporting ATPase subunit delta [Saprospiraceae bacterium]|jgi:F-type H+-transporting ATPase subunit delta